MHSILINMSEKFQYARLRNDRASGNRKYDVNKVVYKNKNPNNDDDGGGGGDATTTTIVAIGTRFWIQTDRSRLYQTRGVQ